MSDTATRGRPRSAEADRAILEATLNLLVEGGFGALSMDAVAARAGVGKATIYRRWKSKPQLVQAAIQALSAGIELPDTGSLRGDILAIAARTMQAANLPASTLVPRLMAEATGEPELHDIFLHTLVQPRRHAIAILLERARHRGEIRADIDTDLAIDLLIGPLIYRFLIAAVGEPMPPEYLQRVLDAALQGLAAPTHNTTHSQVKVTNE